ncbi:hypothetical protein DSECCO2_464190 [anaerobic digester metagenome]
MMLSSLTSRRTALSSTRHTWVETNVIPDMPLRLTAPEGYGSQEIHALIISRP